MKHSKPTSSEKKAQPPVIQSKEQLHELQRLMAQALYRPLNRQWNMQKKWVGGQSMKEFAASFIKPNDRLNAFERLEIYNRQYWFRVLDSLYDDYPGVRTLLGERRFMKLATNYLTENQSQSYTLRNLGSRLEGFLKSHPDLTGPHAELAVEIVRLEWAEIVAFDGPSGTLIGTDDLLDSDPSILKVDLQPYLSLLQCDYPIDLYLQTVKRHVDSRADASNALNGPPRDRPKIRKPRIPQKEPIYLAVHRFDNRVFHKRLEPEAFAILNKIREGKTVAEACEQAIHESQRTFEKETDPTIYWQSTIKEWFDTWTSLRWIVRPDEKLEVRS